MGASLLMWRRKEFILMLSLFALLGVFGLSAGLGASAFDYQELNHQANLVVDSQKLQPKLATYDDINYQITLSADELNNYIWDNLSNYCADTFSSTTKVGTLNYKTYTNKDLYILSSNGSIGLSSTIQSAPPLNIIFNAWYPNSGSYFGNDDSIFQFYDSSYMVVPFDDLVTFVFSESYYGGFKNAFELDIQANQNNGFDGGAVATDIVETLVGGIAGIASGLGAGVSALVSDIFINNGTLSVFGYIVVIFAGIALAIGLSRWVMNFLTSLGAKK